LVEMKRKMSEYVDKGQVVGYHEVKEEPVITERLDASKFKPLRRVSSCDVHFQAVDCSTRTLKRANNWGIYLFRATYAMVKHRNVHWDSWKRYILKSEMRMYVARFCRIRG